MKRNTTFSTIPLRIAVSGPASSSIQAQKFAVGGLRGGSHASLSILSSSTSGHALRAEPLFELARASATTDFGLVKGLRLVKVAGDGRCMFRALVKGLEHGRGSYIAGDAETAAADQLRMAVYDALCRDPKRASKFDQVNYSIDNLEGGRNSYCKRLQQSSFWGGELEILVLSKMLRAPIYVYRTAEEAGLGKFGYIPIVKYGQEWERQAGSAKGRDPVHLLYGNGNHYDLLL